MNLFPIIQPTLEAIPMELPLYRETAWDYKEDKPIWKKGSPVIVEGIQAIVVWAWNALHTVRFQHEIYSWNYGNEIEILIGQNYSEDLKRAEAIRYVRESLLINPYITEVKEISVDFKGTILTIDCYLVTIYGEVQLGRDFYV